MPRNYFKVWGARIDNHDGSHESIAAADEDTLKARVESYLGANPSAELLFAKPFHAFINKEQVAGMISTLATTHIDFFGSTWVFFQLGQAAFEKRERGERRKFYLVPIKKRRKTG